MNWLKTRSKFHFWSGLENKVLSPSWSQTVQGWFRTKNWVPTSRVGDQTGQKEKELKLQVWADMPPEPCLEISELGPRRGRSLLDIGACQPTVHRVAKSQTWLSDFIFFHFLLKFIYFTGSIFNFIICIFYWSVVDLQCFRCTARWFSVIQIRIHYFSDYFLF